MPTPKILTAINLGAMQLLHRVVLIAVPDLVGGLARLKAARGATRGGLVLQPFGGKLGLRRALLAPGALPRRDWLTLTRAVHARGGFTVAQLPSCVISRTENKLQARIERCRRIAMQAQALHFDGAELDASIAPRSPAHILHMVQALIDVWGANRVSVRLAPFGWVSGVDDHHAIGLLSGLVADLNDLEIAYVHLTGAIAPGRGDLSTSWLGQCLRAAYPGMLLASGGFTPATAIAAVEGRWADMIGFPFPSGEGDHLLASVARSAG